MKKHTILLLALLCQATSQANAQTKAYKISFSAKELSVSKQKKEEALKEISFSAENTDDTAYKGYQLTIVPDLKESTLPASDYTINFNSTSFASLVEKNNFYIKISKDSIQDRARTLVLRFKVIKKDGKADDEKNNDVVKETQKITITIEPYDETLAGYNYLAYVGTNFDLVDGIKAKNLFFAANIFIPRFTEAIGFSVSLYGNRTFTSTDTGHSRIASSIANAGDSSFHYYSNATSTRSKVTDNLGANASALIPLGPLSEKGTPMQLYYSPSTEFIWRRINTNILFSDLSPSDTQVVHNPVPRYGTLDMPLKISSGYNSYDVYFGFAGLTLVHETTAMSVRLQGTLAYRLNYSPLVQPSNALTNQYMKNDDLSFSGRLWITEATTGITLEAEIYNSRKHPDPYYGVTLSKALNFKSLGSIFQPLTSR